MVKLARHTVSVIASLVMIHTLSCTGEQFGVNYGLNGNNLPSPAQVVKMYQKCGIGFMRLFEPYPAVLQALAASGSNIKVALGCRNEDLTALGGESPDAAHKWVATNIVPYKDRVAFTWVTLGNEAIPSPFAQSIPKAILNMRAALDAVGLKSTAATTAVAMTVIGVSYPPSAGAFTAESTPVMTEIAAALTKTGSPLMVNVYPYFAYASNPADIPLDYAMFEAAAPVVDGGLKYTSLFEAMVDSVYAALEKVGGEYVWVVVGESGWPSAGAEQASVENARRYNSKLRERVTGRKGTPRRPSNYLNTFVFAMFNENLKQAGIEQNFGLFRPDMSPVYPLFPACTA